MTRDELFFKPKSVYETADEAKVKPILDVLKTKGVSLRDGKAAPGNTEGGWLVSWGLLSLVVP